MKKQPQHFFVYSKTKIKKIAESNDGETFNQIIKERNELIDWMRKLVDEKMKRQRQEERDKEIQALKDLPEGSTVWFASNGEKRLPYGTAMIKVKDKRIKMEVKHSEYGWWTIPYNNLRLTEPDEVNKSFNRSLSSFL